MLLLYIIIPNSNWVSAKATLLAHVTNKPRGRAGPGGSRCLNNVIRNLLTITSLLWLCSGLAVFTMAGSLKWSQRHQQQLQVWKFQNKGSSTLPEVVVKFLGLALMTLFIPESVIVTVCPRQVACHPVPMPPKPYCLHVG